MPILEPEWQCPPENLVCTEHDVHIWRASLALESRNLQQYAQILSIDEQQRADRFRFERDRNRFIAGRGILRSILASYLKIEASQLCFRYGATGKPALENPLNNIGLEFNLSHSQDLMLCAVTLQHPIGIDLEGTRMMTDLKGLTQRFFSPREHKAIQSLPVEQQPFAFLQYWTCKEAILKTSGSGLVNLSQVEICIDDSEVTIVRLEGNCQPSLSIHTLIPAPTYIAAVAIAQPNYRLSFREWSDVLLN